MRQAQYGDTVTVHYTGRLENGEVFGDSHDGEPIEFTIGDGEFIPGLEKGVVGMEVGEIKTITLAPQEAFGLRYEELIVKVEKSEFPERLVPTIGQQFSIRREVGEPLDVTVTDIDEEIVTLDANHPLAGCTLSFSIQLVTMK